MPPWSPGIFFFDGSRFLMLTVDIWGAGRLWTVGGITDRCQLVNLWSVKPITISTDGGQLADAECQLATGLMSAGHGAFTSASSMRHPSNSINSNALNCRSRTSRDNSCICRTLHRPAPVGLVLGSSEDGAYLYIYIYQISLFISAC